MNLGVIKWDLCVLFVQTAVKCTVQKRVLVEEGSNVTGEELADIDVLAEQHEDLYENIKLWVMVKEPSLRGYSVPTVNCLLLMSGKLL